MDQWRPRRRLWLAGVCLWLVLVSAACVVLPVDYGAMRTTLAEEQARWQSLRPAAYTFQIEALSLCSVTTLVVTVRGDQPVAIGEATSDPATARPLWAAGQDAAIPYTFGCWASTIEEFLAGSCTLEHLFAASVQEMSDATRGTIVEVSYDP